MEVFNGRLKTDFILMVPKQEGDITKAYFLRIDKWEGLKWGREISL